ncbi:MAG: M14 family metallopeptidase [Verrucomicrobiales bacterium]
MSPTERNFLSTHRAHDCKDLMRRWRKIARPAGLAVTPFITQAEHQLYYLAPRKARTGRSIYLSAGIHGDEAAPPIGLLHWAEQNPKALQELDVLIFPCLNPWGLTNNVRLNHRGRDLNRDFQNRHIPFVRKWRQVVGSRRFDLALNLHEDYDAQGAYVYELSQKPPFLAERILQKVSSIIPPDQRRTIDISRAKSGVIRRRIRLSDFDDFGLPEAIYLHFHHSDATLTIETPSEFSLFDRVRAQAKAIQVAVQARRRR